MDFDFLVLLLHELSITQGHIQENDISCRFPISSCLSSQVVKLWVIHLWSQVKRLTFILTMEASEVVKYSLSNVQLLGKSYTQSRKFERLFLSQYDHDIEADTPTSIKVTCSTRLLSKSSSGRSLLKLQSSTCSCTRN